MVVYRIYISGLLQKCPGSCAPPPRSPMTEEWTRDTKPDIEFIKKRKVLPRLRRANEQRKKPLNAGS